MLKMIILLMPFGCLANSYLEEFIVLNTNINDYHDKPDNHIFSKNNYIIKDDNLSIETNDNTNSIKINGNYSAVVHAEDKNYIYKTSIPGLGIRIKWETYNTSGGGQILNYFPIFRTCNSPCIVNKNVSVEFIKIGNIRTGSIPSGTELAKVILSDNTYNKNYLRIILGETITVRSKTCIILDDDKSVDLGRYTTDELKKRPYNPKYIDFNVVLRCEQDSSVNMSFVGNATNNKLNNSGSADGVSIIINDENNKVVTITSKPVNNPLINVYSNIDKIINYKAAINVDDRNKLKPGSIDGNVFIELKIN